MTSDVKPPKRRAWEIQEERRPSNASTKALMAAVDFLSQCRFDGWPEATLPDLERIWWRYHDAEGKWRLPETKKPV